MFGLGLFEGRFLGGGGGLGEVWGSAVKKSSGLGEGELGWKGSGVLSKRGRRVLENDCGCWSGVDSKNGLTVLENVDGKGLGVVVGGTNGSGVVGTEGLDGGANGSTNCGRFRHGQIRRHHFLPRVKFFGN